MNTPDPMVRARAYVLACVDRSIRPSVETLSFLTGYQSPEDLDRFINNAIAVKHGVAAPMGPPDEKTPEQTEEENR